jgi:hypothetical protein
MAKNVLRQKALHDEIKSRAEADLEFFIRLVHPNRVLGGVHIELIKWWTRSEAKSHQLVLLPRDHGKSAMVAYRVAWEVTKNPAVRVLYISSTANLATKQLKFIKDILTSDIYKRYWPEMVHEDVGKREKWTESEIAVDHPLRRLENVRDPTIFTAGLTTSITGLHCDIAVLDDVVVKENADTEDGREKVASQYSLLSSIEGVDSQEWVVGTRYHPKDLYNTMMETFVDQYDENGDLIEPEPLFEKFERQVESLGDGTGEFLWPRQQRKDGKWFGFDEKILARKRAQYIDQRQFRAQYYNDTYYEDEEGIKREYFQYYDKGLLKRSDGFWYYKSNRLSVFAAIDFAFSLRQRADSTSIIVVGVDADRNYYVLDIDRFKTTLIREYFERILRLHERWGFRKIRAEVSVAQAVIVQELRDNYIRPNGLSLSVDEFKPNRHEGTKEDRMRATLEPKYQNRQMWHYHGGNCQILEDELVSSRPPHDDVKDALTACLDICVPPTVNRYTSQQSNVIKFMSHGRFGGLA